MALLAWRVLKKIRLAATASVPNLGTLNKTIRVIFVLVHDMLSVGELTMRKPLIAKLIAISVGCCINSTPVMAQTQILPERNIADPRINYIQEKLNRTLVNGRSTTTLIRSEGIRKTDEARRIQGIIADLSLSIGLVPVLEMYSSAHQLALVIRNVSSEDDTGVSQSLTLELLDVKTESGSTLIMSSNIDLRCPLRSYGTFSAPQPSCDINNQILEELFFRLR